MSSSESRAQVMKPLLIKAGIPAALSVAAYICSKIISKRVDLSLESTSMQADHSCNEIEQPRDCESFHSLDSTSSDDTYQCGDEGVANTHVVHGCNLEEKLVELESQVEYLRNKERDLKARFLKYRAVKERESMLLEVRNKMVLEKTRAECLLKEISLVEEENQRIGGLIIEYIKHYYQLEELKIENGLLRRKARKMCKRAKQRLRIIRKQKLLVKAKDKEIVSNQDELQRRANVIQELEDEVKQLKDVVDHLQREKIVIINKMDLAETSLSSNTKVESTDNVWKEYENVMRELEQLQKDHATVTNELTYLKWSNGCLRQELTRLNEQREHSKGENGTHLSDLFELEEHGHENGSSDVISSHATSKRRRFMKKFKNWVDGGHSEDNKEKNEIKCFGNHSVCEEAENLFVHSRKSCSSV